MPRRRVPYFICHLFLLISLIVSGDAFAWSPHAHTFIAQKVGVAKPSYSNFTDLVREENKTLLGPWHNIVHGDKRAGDGRVYPALDAWAKENHKAFDDVFESVFPMDQRADDRFNTRIVLVSITSSDDLKREIARIANISIAPANRCYEEKRLLTVDEALKQTALSVSLLRAMIADAKRTV